jgi:hypothetical protein
LVGKQVVHCCAKKHIYSLRAIGMSAVSAILLDRCIKGGSLS